MPSIINATTTNGVAVSGDNSGSLALQTNNGTTAVTISTGQNVGIGTVSPNEKLDVVANSSGEDGAIVVRTQFGANYFGGVGNYPAFGYKSGGVLYAALGYDTNNNNLFTGPASSKFPAYLCRAWVNFDGDSGGSPAIRASGNVSSITDNGTGDYTVNFTAAMPDANYSIVGGFSREPVGGGNSTNTYNINTNNSTGGDVAPTTSGFRVAILVYGVGGRDINYINLAVFR